MCQSISWKLVAPMLNVEEDEIVPREVFCLYERKDQLANMMKLLKVDNFPYMKLAKDILANLSKL
jgi:hypothetical protein